MKYQGRTAFEGYAIDEVLIYGESDKARQKSLVIGENQFDRFEYARKAAISTFDELYEKTLKELGEDEAILFQTYHLMAEDLDFEDLVRSFINEGKSAEDAVNDASKQLADTFAALEDDYMKQRAVDVLEVGKSIVGVLTGNDQVLKLTKPVILICKDLAASVLMRFNRNLIKGLVLINGNENSHVSIFARTLEIPTLVDIHGDLVLSNNLNGHTAVVDCIKGQLIIDPTNEEINEYKDKQAKYLEEIAALKELVGKPSVTKDGVKIKIYANIASNLELESVLANDAEGVGLFRSEFIYLASKDFPTEDFQFNYYREVIEEMKGKEVVIRTLDIGADKKVGYFGLEKEENPALGYRSIRICRKRPEIFYTQLRALYRASVYGKLSIMVPMIVSLEEVNFVNESIAKVKADLKRDNIKFDDKVKVGIMIETPAAALISDELAKHVDFFSIGTNDLSQYTLACDRLNPQLNMTFNPHHPAILRLIKLTVENAHKAGIICGMCGELGRDPELIPFFAAIHLDEISCSSAYVLRTRKALLNVDTKKVDVNKYIN